MVKPIYLTSLEERVGKSFLSIGIIEKLQKEGKKVAYFKPIGIPKGAFTNKMDIDCGFIMKTVFETELPYEIVSPTSIPDNYYVDLINLSKKEEYLEKITKAYEEVTKDMEYVVIEGAPSLKKYMRVGLDDLSVAQAIGINELILICTESSDAAIDNIFFTKKYFDFREVKIKGLIFNIIDYEYVARIKELEENHIKRYGLPVIGIVEKSLELISARVKEVMSAIGGELINDAASAGLDNMVETYLIGAMKSQAALKYFRQVKRAAVVTGGDRTDLIMAALNTDVSCLILTGYIMPDLSVITVANNKNIPIILSPSDTYTTIRNLERLKPGIQEDEIGRVLSLIEDSIDWDLLL